MAAINHPNVVTIHAVEEYHDLPFIVMEFLQGPSLRDHLRKERRLDPIDALRLSAQIATGLAAAHAQGVIHRDVKPGNIMFDGGVDRVKITDFGLARVAIDNVDLTSRELAVGTPAYMAPEQVAGDSVDSRADLFAMGCVMYAMLAGHSPFQGKHALEMAIKVTEHDPIALHIVNERTPRFFSEIVQKLLSKDPDRRYQSAMEVAELLNSHIAALNQTATDEMSAVLYGTARKRRKPRRNWVMPAIVTTVLVLCGVVGFAMLGRRHNGVNSPLIQSLFSSPEAKAGGVLTVGQADTAQFRSLTEALAAAGPGAEIQIVDGGTYIANIVIDDAARWNNVSIRGTGAEPPTITAANKAVVLIANTPGVVLDRLKIHPTKPEQHAIDIRGLCPGVTVQHVDVESEFDEWALVLVSNEASGTAERPIVIRESTFKAKLMAVVVQGIDAPTEHIHVIDNSFSGDATHLQLNHHTPSTVVRGNRFVGGTGIGMSLIDNSSSVLIANNTFLGNDPWLNLRHSSPAAADIRIVNNLILGTQSNALVEQGSPYRLADFISNWVFDGNRWEGTRDSEDVLNSIAEFHEAVETLSRDASDTLRYLRLPADSPLATAGAGGEFPAYVGAFPPVPTKEADND
ncbi:MAG: protein kinase [Planctomycetota bacterium]|nr:protein kinase [Planctomycetota bacterium]